MFKFKKNDKILISLLLMITLSTSFSFGYNIFVNSQQIKDVYEFEKDRKIIACEYRINGVWVRQFTGRVYELNDTGFIIEWYKYDETTPIRNVTFYNEKASNYEIKTKILYNYNTSKTIGLFRVYWFRGKNIINVDTDSGSLIVRDINKMRVYINDIEKIRIGNYDIGGFE